MRPLIGISTYREQATWGFWDVPAVLLPAAYADAVAAAGGEPVLLPTGSVSGDVVARLDGLVLAGGADVDPARYGEETGPHTATRPERDASEIALLEAALERDLPLLAVCRGMQLLNAVLGGTLLQHLPDVPGTEPHQLGLGRYAERTVRTASGSRLGTLLGPAATVNCHHHQALDRIAPALTASAWAEDGVVEGVEDAARRFCLAVQWHPEEGEDLRLFKELVAASSDPEPRQVDSERAFGSRSSTSTAP
ncbi:gamma-glutamyl-gamma-aminobutyrate hydrolase family protein [Blastococcus sp. CT_GayMR16]|uniref:gamma-glutamyl-gamma-aminobutyrate hydrolase family protein n=1 Tax=Blastococcus sp. CT_GayMR16 TaxID=2559607 RepID=UPI0010741A0E|nr:gamma-glutamyl-gamma-aminobutyrate hydrolase family protein [Blastococcus sp. CT_GayMR16]TFV87348.1 gamma-glutamyl-gamma-aminobutyrate hydrolase family protein [Blastococcus sp. CT_GayMR16]